MTHPSTRSPARRPRWLLVLLAPLVVLGVLAMHSLLGPGVVAPAADPAASVAMVHDTATHDATHGDPAHEGGTSGAMADCGGLVAMCLALLGLGLGLVLWRRRLLLRVLWERPPSTTPRLGTTRQPFPLLTPLQRTTVLRC